PITIYQPSCRFVPSAVLSRRIDTCCLLWFLAPLLLDSFPTRRSSDLSTPPTSKVSSAGSTARQPVRTSMPSSSIAWRTSAYSEQIGRAHVLNSSHVKTSYAVFCSKKKRKGVLRCCESPPIPCCHYCRMARPWRS